MFATAVRIERDLGVPSVSFDARTGHRSCTPEDYRRYLVTLRQGPAPVTDVFPAGVAFAPSGDWASGNQAWDGLPGEFPYGLFRAAFPRTGLARFPGIRLSSD